MDAQYKQALETSAGWHGVPAAGLRARRAGAPVDQLAEMLGLRISVLADVGLAAMARRCGMRRMDFKALACIAQLEPLPTGHLVHILGMSPGGVTAILNRLEDQGLIRRDRSIRDRRQVSLCLAHDGGADRVFPEYASQALQGVVSERDPKEVERFVDFLSECLRALEQGADRWVEG